MHRIRTLPFCGVSHFPLAISKSGTAYLSHTVKDSKETHATVRPFEY